MSKVAIKMLAILSGDGESWGPGSVVHVDAAEAERLIAMGAAVAAEVQPVAAEAAPPVAAPRRGRKPKAR